MGIMQHQQLTASQIEVVAGLLDGWAEVSELTETHSGLAEFAAVAKTLLGEINWRAVEVSAPKFSEIAAAEKDNSGTTVVDPAIMTMSLTAGRRQAGELQGQVAELLTSGRCTRQEAYKLQHATGPDALRALQVFVSSRSAIPSGTFRE